MMEPRAVCRQDLYCSNYQMKRGSMHEHDPEKLQHENTYVFFGCIRPTRSYLLTLGPSVARGARWYPNLHVGNK